MDAVERGISAGTCNTASREHNRKDDCPEKKRVTLALRPLKPADGDASGRRRG